MDKALQTNLSLAPGIQPELTDNPQATLFRTIAPDVFSLRVFLTV